MKYNKIKHGIFQKKVNRFIAIVSVDNVIEEVHIKNTGRLTELLVYGVQVLLEVSNNPKRKTKYSLIAVWKNERLVNIDSQAPNVVAFDAILAGKVPETGQVDTLQREVTYKNARFDLYYENLNDCGFIEVKGVTLENNNVAMFPDAPTTRGTKHVLELIDAVLNGFQATILFIVQMEGCHQFTPHIEMDPDFSKALLQASEQGVQILAFDTIVKEDKITLNKAVPVIL